MNPWKERAVGIILSLFELVAGVLLLADPVKFTSAVILVTGAALMILGLVEIVRYFRALPEEAALGQLLLKGLIAILAGGFCVFQTDWFLITFPVLTILYGLLILVTGVWRLQRAVDLIRLGTSRWFLDAIAAALTILCALIILCNPFASTLVLWTFTGAALIVAAIFDLITLFIPRTTHR